MVRRSLVVRSFRSPRSPAGNTPLTVPPSSVTSTRDPSGSVALVSWEMLRGRDDTVRHLPRVAGVGDHRTGELAAEHVTVIDIPESRDAPFPTCNGIVSMC